MNDDELKNRTPEEEETPTPSAQLAATLNRIAPIARAHPVYDTGEGTPLDEQEDPYAGRNLAFNYATGESPAEEEEEEEEEPWEGPADPPLPGEEPAEDWNDMDDEDDEPGTPPEEQEDPYAGRNLPGQTDLPGMVRYNEETGEYEGTPPEEQEDPYVGRSLPGDDGRSEEEQAAAELADVPMALEEARERYWKRVLTGSADTVPDEVRRRAGVDEGGLSDAQSEYRLLSTINRSWAADHMGISRERVRASWARLRRELARRYHVADDEQELFTALSVEAQDAPRRERVQAIYEAHYRAALLGQDSASPPLPRGMKELPYAADLASEARCRGASLRQRYLPLAREVAQVLDALAAMEDDALAAPRVLPSLPAFVRSVDALAGMDERERELVYTIARCEFGEQNPEKKNESLYRTMLRASRRGAVGLGMGVGQALAHTAVASMDSLGKMLGGEREQALRRKAGEVDRRTLIANELRHLLQEDIQPLAIRDEAGLASQLAVDAAGATPAALSAFCGGAGFATLGLAGMGEAVSAARKRAPEGSQWLQYLAGLVGGGIQASIYMGMGRVGGQLLGNAVGNFARSTGSGAQGYAISSLGVLGAMGVEEAKLLFAGKAADAAGLAAQEVAARLEQTASNIDWRAYGDNAQDIELNLREAAMVLPFILIGSGRVALRHFRSRDAVLGDGHALRQWGMDEPTIDAIMKEPDINRQGELLRDALRGSRRWSAPGSLPLFARALRLLNTDSYQGFKDPQLVCDFMKLPSQAALAPRPPYEPHLASNPEHVRYLQERYGSGERPKHSRLAIALQLWDEWTQKAHLVPESAAAEGALPTEHRRAFFGRELLMPADFLPRRLRPGSFYAPQAEAESMAMLRDRVSELHDLSYQMLLSSYSIDSLSQSSRSLEILRKDGEKARRSLLSAVGRFVLRRATGTPEQEAMEELAQSVTNYFRRRRYTVFPPEWMKRVSQCYTHKLDEYARNTFLMELKDVPEQLRSAFRVALGFRACAASLYALLPVTPAFRTCLSNGLSPAEAYVHLLSRELDVDMAKAPGVAEMLAPFGPRDTDMRAYRLRNEAAYEVYRQLTGCELESARGGENGSMHWRLRRPNGSYTSWHRRKRDAINEMMGHSAFFFMPSRYERSGQFFRLDPQKRFDLNDEGRAEGWHYTGYDNLCRIALRDAARSWVESAPYAMPGFELGTLRGQVYLGGLRPQLNVLMKEDAATRSMRVDTYTMATPLRLAQARFRTYWWRQLNAGQLSAADAGDELVKLRVISPEERQRVLDIAKPPLMPTRPDIPLRLTPPPDIGGMNRAMADHLTTFSMRYFLQHLDDMPLPSSTREWFKLAPLCPLQPGKLPRKSMRISLKEDSDWLTTLHNRVAAGELQKMAPGVAALRRAEREGLLIGSPLVSGLRDAVGLNRTLNLEQAWCATHAGCEAMMAAEPAFWRFMQQPCDGMKGLSPRTQEALRLHVDGLCRTELSPEAMEAEGRGEKPDYVLYGLQNLQEVLSDYPALHQYGYVLDKGQAQLRRLTPHEIEQPTSRFAEPEYDHIPLYRGSPMHEGSTLTLLPELPEALRDDSRVRPALHLLSALRSLPGTLPYVRREGIAWRGNLYGGPKGMRPRGLSKGWKYERPLTGLIEMLKLIDAMQANLPEGESLNLLVEEMPGLAGEELDLSPLNDVSLYRRLDTPGHLCRLMPGEPDAGNVAARAPYMVQSFAGLNLNASRTIPRAEDLHRSYVPLERFRPQRLNIQLEKTGEELRRLAIDNTVNHALSSTLRRISQGHPQGSMAGLRELLLRFAEDSGFSHSLREANPRELLAGQIHSLRLARELLLCVCGKEPEAAYRRLIRLSHRLRRSNGARESLKSTLFRAADALYKEGETKLREPKKRGPRPSKHSGPKAPTSTVREDLRNLRLWEEKQEEEALERTHRNIPRRRRRNPAD